MNIYHPILADEFVPAFLKKEFRRVVRLISLELEEENFSEIDIEDYLKDFIEEIVY